MAVYAELKRIGWYCINAGNPIKWYKKKLYDDWWNSLTEEEKEQVEHNRRVAKEKRQKEAEKSVQSLLNIMAMMAGVASSTNSKYGDLYDEFGFPKR